MKLIRTARLQRRQKQIIQCEIDLCQLGDDACLVNLRQGSMGEVWRESTRTQQAVPLEVAERLFTQAIAQRQAQGFVLQDEAKPLSSPAAHQAGPNLSISSNSPNSPNALNPSESPAAYALLARLQAAPWQRLPERQRTRTLWRIGELRLKSAVPVLVGLLGQGGVMQDYCLAFAIGRCGDAGAAQAMQALQANSKSAAVKRMALQAWLQLSDTTARQQHAQALVADWPAALRSAWAEQDAAQMQHALAHANEWKSLTLAEVLEQLDQVACCAEPVQASLARRVLLHQLQTLPLGAGVFQAVRHLYKAAEMRADAILFGLLHYRFEIEAPLHAGGAEWVFLERRMVRYGQEVTRADSRVAYSALTRNYLRRRTWRTLRRLGQLGDADFITMASGVLLAMDDADAAKAVTRAAANGELRRYDPWSQWMLLNRLLHANGNWFSQRNGCEWYQRANDAPTTGRSEAFPALWDAQPAALLQLLQLGRCNAIHQFASRALRDNPAFCAAIDEPILRQLLASNYPASARFAFELCCQRAQTQGLSVDWLLVLLQATLPEARQYALDWISRDPAQYSANALLVASMLCASHAPVRGQGRLLCHVALAQPDYAGAIILQLLDWLEHCQDGDWGELALSEILAELQPLLEQALRPHAAQAPWPRLLALLEQEAVPVPVRVLAAHWLLLHATPVTQVPGATLDALLRSEQADLHSTGVALFGALPDSILLQQAPLFAAFCTYPDAKVRHAIDPALRRLAGTSPEFCSALLQPLLDCLFRTEVAPGMHDDVLRWLHGPLQTALNATGPGTVMRLSLARSKAAQNLAALLLVRYGPDDFNVAEWASFGANSQQVVRNWAWLAYLARVERVRAEMEAALRLLDSRWDDSLEFACQFFRERCEASDWTPQLLVSLCDHLNPTVQRFGREMLQTHFNLADVTDYLLKLAQHPSQAMQLFVSAWLERAAGNIDHLHQLEPYFLSVLSQINRGRIVKNRVLAFLNQQAMASEAAAAMVQRLYARLVVSMALGDKAHYIEGLRAIQSRYPGLPASLQIHPVRVGKEVCA